MRDALPQFAAAFAVPLALALFGRLANRSRPVDASLTSGRSGMARPVAIFLMLGGAVFGLFGGACLVYGIVADDTALLALSPFFVAFGGFMVWTTVISSSPGWQVVWDADGVSRPSTRWGLRRASDRASIPWANVIDVGIDRSGCRYVEGTGGSRIYWNDFYAGRDVLERALEKQRRID